MSTRRLLGIALVLTVMTGCVLKRNHQIIRMADGTCTVVLMSGGSVDKLIPGVACPPAKDAL